MEQLTRQRPDRIIVNGELVSAPSAVKLVHDVVNSVDSAKIVKAALFDTPWADGDWPWSKHVHYH